EIFTYWSSDVCSSDLVARRIAPVAGFELVDANAPKVFKTGEQVFQAVCTACHTAGVAGAPKVGDKAAWAPFIKSGFESMLNVARSEERRVGKDRRAGR